MCQFLGVCSGLSLMLDLLNNLTVTSRLNSGKSWLATDNFCAFQITNLGERETRIRTNRIKLIETTEPSQGENFLFVKEAVKRNRLVWLVYQDKHHIIDCNISTNVHDLVKFDKKFSSYGRDWITNKFHENGKAAKYSSDIDFRGLLRQCRLFKRQIRAIRIEHHHEEHNHKRSKSNQHNKDDTKAGTRPKRSAFSMIYPGTNWCGAGDRASGGYEDLGEHAATDSCCREHDHCPYYISGFKTKYNFWNYRFHTLSHCTCEEK